MHLKKKYCHVVFERLCLLLVADFLSDLSKPDIELHGLLIAYTTEDGVFCEHLFIYKTLLDASYRSATKSFLLRLNHRTEHTKLFLSKIKSS